MVRHILFIIAFLLTAPQLKAQDPIFSQFYSAPLMLNPAFAGNTYTPRLAFNYRNQYPGWLDGASAYSTYAASYEQFIEDFNSGFGVMLKSDDAGGGLYKLTKFTADYAYRVQVNRDFNLKFGVEAGFRQFAVDWDRLIFFDQLDPLTGAVDPIGNPNPTNEVRPDNLNKTYFDIGAGLLAYGPTFYGGISLKHLTRPNESILGINDGLNEGLATRISVHGGAQINLREGNNRSATTFISPNLLFVKQGDQGQLNVGAYAGMGLIFAGGWYRHAFGNPDAAILLVGVKKGIFKIGYSYDFTISALQTQASGGTNGAHEISLILNFDQSEAFQRRRRASRYNDCFQIFR
ncbi:MAG: type IX secretion system membrane protein PorP/SprF [Bacteroidetes bacterium]|nr:MAG: type IX secretion system membrane protein PorP/SprF [Bacteroidota bacterium]